MNEIKKSIQIGCPTNGATWAIWTVVDFSEKQKRETYRAINKMMKEDYEDG